MDTGREAPKNHEDTCCQQTQTEEENTEIIVIEPTGFIETLNDPSIEPQIESVC